MEKTILTLEHIRRLNVDTYELVLSGDTSAMERPGQFVNLELPELFLRRPVSVANWTEDGLLLLVRAVGVGTARLTAAEPGTRFDTLVGLGNGFDPEERGREPVLIGGGIGLAPLYALARRMTGLGLTPTVALGFRTGADAFYLEEFAALGCSLFLATEDGSLGTKGFVTDCVRAHIPQADYAFACGPTPMLRSVAGLTQLSGGQFSLEARMGCGFGVCLGCTVVTAHGVKRVCADGPVFRKEELVW